MRQAFPPEAGCDESNQTRCLPEYAAASHKAPAEWILSTTSSLPPHVICLPCFLRILSGYCWYCQLLRLGGRHSIGWPCPLPPPSPLSTTLPRPSPSCPIQNTLHHYTSDISRYAFEDEKSDTTDTVWDIHISKLKLTALDDWSSAQRILCQYQPVSKSLFPYLLTDWPYGKLAPSVRQIIDGVGNHFRTRKISPMLQWLLQPG